MKVHQAVGVLDPDVLQEQILDPGPVAVVNREGAAPDDVDDVAVAEGDPPDRVDPEFESDFKTLAAGVIPPAMAAAPAMAPIGGS